MDKLDPQAVLARLKGDVLAFGRFVNPHMFYVKSPYFHKEVGRDLISPNRKLNIIAPRGTAKSSLVAEIFVLYHIMFEPGPKVVVIVSKTQGNAINRLQAIKDVLDYSESFRALFGYWGQHSARKWMGAEVVLKDGTYLVAKGTGQMLRGLKYGNQRPTLIVVDDPEDENNTKTPEAMEGNLRWLLQSATPALDAHRGRIIVIGTPQNEGCMVITLQGMAEWVTRRYKYVNEAADGSLWSLWPEMKSVDELLAEKADLESIGRVSYWYRERQCEIMGDEDQLFRKEDFRYWDGELLHKPQGSFLHLTQRNGKITDELLPVTVFSGIDPASTTSITADCTAIVHVAVDENMNRYLLPYINKRMSPMVVADKILSEYRIVKPDRMRIESNGYQEMLREYVRTIDAIPGLEIKEIARNSKSKRIEGLEPLFRQHRIHMRAGMHELEDQLLLYPRARHDDLLDALYYACKGNFPPTHEAPSGREPGEFPGSLFRDGERWVLA